MVSSNFNIFIATTKLSNKAFSARITELGLSILAPLKTAIEEPVTLPTIPTTSGTCYVSAETTVEPGDMEVSYYASE